MSNYILTFFALAKSTDPEIGGDPLPDEAHPAGREDARRTQREPVLRDELHATADPLFQTKEKFKKELI